MCCRALKTGKALGGRGNPKCPICLAMLGLGDGRYADFPCPQCEASLQVEVDGYVYRVWTLVEYGGREC